MERKFELLAQLRPLHLLQLPQNQDPETALPFWFQHIWKFKERIEKETGTRITDDKLWAAIRQTNEERKAKKALMDLAKTRPSPMTGQEVLTITHKIGFLMDKRRGIRLIHEFMDELKHHILQGESPSPPDAPRILLTGVPVDFDSDKVIRLIERTGANVVCFEFCGGYQSVSLIDEEKEPLRAIAEKYLSTPCSIMSPNTGRYELLAQLIKEFSVDGVVDLTWQACHTYNVESYSLGKFVEERFHLPFLHLETDYSESDTEQLRVRIEAFLEMLKG